MDLQTLLAGIRHDTVEHNGETLLRVPAEFGEDLDSTQLPCNECRFWEDEGHVFECPQDSSGENDCVSGYPAHLSGNSTGIIYIKPTVEAVEKYITAVAVRKLEGR